MILKNITTRKSALKTGLLFWITIELEDDNGQIHRRTVDFPKGWRREDVIKGLEDLIKQVRNA